MCGGARLLESNSSWSQVNYQENLTITYKQFNCRPQDFLLLETKMVKTRYGQRTFEYAGPRLWNALPLQVRTIDNIESFKRQLKTLLFRDTEGLKRRAFRYTWVKKCVERSCTEVKPNGGIEKLRYIKCVIIIIIIIITFTDRTNGHILHYKNVMSRGPDTTNWFSKRTRMEIKPQHQGSLSLPVPSLFY